MSLMLRKQPHRDGVSSWGELYTDIYLAVNGTKVTEVKQHTINKLGAIVSRCWPRSSKRVGKDRPLWNQRFRPEFQGVNRPVSGWSGPKLAFKWQ